MRHSQDLRTLWDEGVVDRGQDHIQIRYGERNKPVALVTRHADKRFKVQFLLRERPGDAHSRRILNEVRGDLTHYLFGLVGPDSWAFAQFHCGTVANFSSRVRWSWHPKESRG
jgi:hypothetical protein